ncbi:MAG: Outer membrane beta-barrel assembly protein BamB [uncultured Lysobacter sp.]|uniref:Outer membrane protein assembly factor BamB n=1 Tax=uncultured Lysobacter sp. TaxID=271060 RepID=A0A6J4L1J6_9GAMM|nr:MAG: Outer membrane beta-barrel assembly protein BamB [uncultured Lysobacter sp.]
MKAASFNGNYRRPVGSAVSRVAAAALCMSMLGGCATVKGWFGNDKDKPNEPVALSDITPSMTAARLWSANVGEGEKRLGSRQGPVVADGRVYAAATEGGVRALDLQTGAQVWRFESDLRLSGGPGAGEGLVVAGSLEGDVVALDASTGAEKWRTKVSSEVVAAPAIGQGLVFVRSNDGRVTALDAATGERRWFWNHEVPALSVRGNDAPAVGPGYVFIGNDDGTVSAVVSGDGRPVWEQVVGAAEGRTELDRMADVDGTPVLDGTTLFATSFKNQTVAIDAPSGRPMWVADRGGAGRAAVAPQRVVVTSSTGAVFGLDKAGGSVLWQQPGLLRRGVTAPAIHGEYALVGDYDGYLHWLSLEDGSIVGRSRVGRKAFRAAPVVADGVALVQNINGELTAFRIGQ